MCVCVLWRWAGGRNVQAVLKGSLKRYKHRFELTRKADPFFSSAEPRESQAAPPESAAVPVLQICASVNGFCVAVGAEQSEFSYCTPPVIGPHCL